MQADEFSVVDGKPAYETFDLGDFALSTGFTLPGAQLAYKTHGTLNAAKDNAIVLPHAYSGDMTFMDAFVGRDRPLNPEKYFIIQPAQLGSGFGSSPSNSAAPYNAGAFPPLAVRDDVRAQHRLVTERFGIDGLELVSGYSMGGQQTYAWAVEYPDMVRRAMPIAATAISPEYNRIYLDVIESCLRDDPAFADGFYEHPGAVHRGLRKHAHVTALMGLTAGVYEQEAWRDLGFGSRADFVQGYLEAYFLPMEPNNLLCQLRKSYDCDTSSGYPDLATALGRITARTIVVAFAGDLFFSPELIAEDAAKITHGEYREIGSVWGHFSMYGLNDPDRRQIDELYADILGAPGAQQA